MCFFVTTLDNQINTVLSMDGECQQYLDMFAVLIMKTSVIPTGAQSQLLPGRDGILSGFATEENTNFATG